MSNQWGHNMISDDLIRRLFSLLAIARVGKIKMGVDISEK